MDNSNLHTSIVVELENQEESEYQKAYQIDLGDLDIPRDYVIDQVFCGENLTVYAVFEISNGGLKLKEQLNDSNFDVRGDRRINRGKSFRKLVSDEKICSLPSKARYSETDVEVPSRESHGVRHQVPREEHNSGEEDKEFDFKTAVAPQKISLGTNTSMAKFTPLFYDGKEDTTEVEKDEKSEKSEGLKSRPKEKNKNSVLKEIKKLQKKINSLIRTIESNDFDFDAEDFEISGADSTSFEQTSKNLDVEEQLQTSRKKRKKHDEIPIFSPLSFPPIPRRPLPKHKRTKTVKKPERREIPVQVTKSVSLLSIGYSATQIIFGADQSEANLRKISSDCRINWGALENWRGPGHSKSEVKNHVVLLDPKCKLMNGVRKSLSLELRNDKLEVICLKKIKNLPFKLDGNLKPKGNLRLLPKRKLSLRDSLPLLNCEMGDEVTKTAKASNVDLMEFAQVRNKQNGLSFEKINLKPNKNANVEEGDAKSVPQKKNLASLRFTRNNAELEFHFCNRNDMAPDDLLKAEKNLQMNKLKLKPLENSTDPPQRACCDFEKPTTPNGQIRKAINGNFEGRKEANTVKKPGKAKPRDKLKKPDGKDANPLEQFRLKSVVESPKNAVRVPDTRIKANRRIKSDLVNSKTSRLGKCGFEEKPEKIDRLPRPIFPKREPAEAANYCGGSKDKDCKMREKSSFAPNSSGEKSVMGLTYDKPQTINPLEEQANLSDKKQSQTSEQQPTSVIVELLSEKPQSDNLVLSEVQKDCSESEQNRKIQVVPAFKRNKNLEESNGDDSNELKKPILKSLWALTKLILFEDGTQKLEILEASLNPPDWV